MKSPVGFCETVMRPQLDESFNRFWMCSRTASAASSLAMEMEVFNCAATLSSERNGRTASRSQMIGR